MLKVENISTGYGKKQVLYDVSIDVKQGEIVLLAGSNGSGKSTLLKAIYGLLPIWNSGKVWFNGENITGDPTAHLLKKGLLYIPQKNNLFEDLTVIENLEMAGLTLKPRILKQRIENTLSTFPILISLLYRTPMKLSGGERQLLTLAMATLHQPKLILADEPFTGLSNKYINLLVSIFQKLSRQDKIVFVISEHHIRDTISITKRIYGFKADKSILETIVTENFKIHELNKLYI